MGRDERMKLVIDRSRWLRGDANSSLLRDAHGHMCCLGFYGLACGIHKESLLLIGDPESTAEGVSWPDWILRDADDHDLSPRNSAATGILIDINDKVGDESEREARIAAIFAKHGVDVEFIDGPVSP